jgi:hypothetical protein
MFAMEEETVIFTPDVAAELELAATRISSNNTMMNGWLQILFTPASVQGWSITLLTVLED